MEVALIGSISEWQVVLQHGTRTLLWAQPSPLLDCGCVTRVGLKLKECELLEKHKTGSALCAGKIDLNIRDV